MALRILGMSYGQDMEESCISITDKVHKPFTKKSSSLVFPVHPNGHITSMVDAKRTVGTLRMSPRP